MKLMVVVPVSEIDVPWRTMMTRIAIASLISFTAIAILMVRHVTEPLKRLTAALKKILTRRPACAKLQISS